MLRNAVRIRDGQLKRVLLFFGGIDTRNFTGSAIAALQRARIPEIQVDVVIGAMHPARAAVEAMCKKLAYRCHVQTSKMADLMLTADLAVGAGGVACWERAALGLPAIAVCAADNQALQLMDAAKAGLLYFPEIDATNSDALARHISSLSENPTLRARISELAFSAVDGKGTLRILNVMICGGVQIRTATESDSELLFEWRNHPEIRAVARNQQEIDLTTHRTWVSSVLNDPARCLLIGLRQGRPIGTVRFDLRDEVAELSIYLAPDAMAVSEGLGHGMLRAAEAWLFERYPQVQYIHAYVLGDNFRSQRFFVGDGYEVDSITYVKTRQRND